MGTGDFQKSPVPIKRFLVFSTILKSACDKYVDNFLKLF